MGRTMVSLGALMMLAAASQSALAQTGQETRVLVRAVANDAKVIGSGVGGARIKIVDVGTGAVLAEGVQEGSTGSTRAIMVDARSRGQTAYGADSSAAAFLATLSLTRPTRVEIVAEGPLGESQATQRASKTLLLIPGYDLVGEGVILVLNGFTVEILDPVGGATARPGEPLTVRARVTMLCGCPTEPGGMWDSNGIRVLARLLSEAEVIEEVVLEYSGETSIYAGALPIAAAGSYAVELIAIDRERANSGMARRALQVSR